MGICASKGNLNVEDRKKEKDLQSQLDQAEKADNRIKKLLLLGAGESGKSTLFKQCQTLYGSGFEQPVGNYSKHVYSNIWIIINALCQNVDKFGLIDPSLNLIKESVEHEASLKPYAPAITPEHATKIKALWADRAIQLTYQNRAKFQLYDSAEYFMNKVDEIAAPDYVPNTDDILRIRVRTTGIREADFNINGQQFKMFDVGGQRSERKKWIHCFENVSALLWVCAMSSYDQTLFEDGTLHSISLSLSHFTCPFLSREYLI